jgi:CRP-like cAMP-binding protein
VSDQELITAVSAAINEDEAPVTTAQAIANRVGYSRYETSKRLNRLAEAEKLSRDRLNGNVVIYWPSD